MRKINSFISSKPVVRKILEKSTDVECGRSFNSRWYDEWRRHGHVFARILSGITPIAFVELIDHTVVRFPIWRCMRHRNRNVFNSIYTCSIAVCPMAFIIERTLKFYSRPDNMLSQWKPNESFCTSGKAKHSSILCALYLFSLYEFDKNTN